MRLSPGHRASPVRVVLRVGQASRWQAVGVFYGMIASLLTALCLGREPHDTVAAVGDVALCQVWSLAVPGGLVEVPRPQSVAAHLGRPAGGLLYLLLGHYP